MVRITTFVLILLCFAACSRNPTRNNPRPTTPRIPIHIGAKPMSTEDSDAAYRTQIQDAANSIDVKIIRKAESVFGPIIRNDDKKAKLAYGRAVRSLPEIVQLGLDLRFKNYEHAATALAKTDLTDDQKKFWSAVIGMKPSRLSKGVCEEVKKGTYEPKDTRMSDSEATWNQAFEDYFHTFIGKDARTGAQKESELDLAIDQIPCETLIVRSQDGPCPALNENLQHAILKDDFFDKLHNMKRRDTAFVTANYKNLDKLAMYQPYVNIDNILKLYKSVSATDYSRQAHFLRRFTSIAKDMRTENIFNRAIGSIILGETSDVAFTRKLNNILKKDELITALTGIDHEMAFCNLAPSKAVVKPAKNLSGKTPSPSPTATATPSVAATAAPTPIPTVTPEPTATPGSSNQ